MAGHRGSFEGSPSAANPRIAPATGLFLCALLLGLQACGGGSPGGSAAQPVVPTFTTIDAPGAGVGAFSGTTALDINAGGDIVGLFMDSNNVSHAFLRTSAGTLTVFDAPGTGMQLGGATTAVSINRSGTIAGSFWDQQAIQHGYVRTLNGTFTTFDVPGSLFTMAISINDGGAIAGTFGDANGPHGFVRASSGTFTTFDAPGIGTALLISSRINAGGAVVGFFIDSNFAFHGFLRAANGTLTTLDAPTSVLAVLSGTEVQDINASGVIVGAIVSGSQGPPGVRHSFLRATDGTYTLFDPPNAGSAGSGALGINDSGAIVGDYFDANLVQHGYLRNPDGTFITIDPPNAAQLPFSLTNLGTTARHINAGGAIVGVFSDASGTRHGFVRE